jgi:hypothetical protein
VGGYFWFFLAETDLARDRLGFILYRLLIFETAAGAAA